MNVSQGYERVPRPCTCLKVMNISRGYQRFQRLWTCLKAMNLCQGYEIVSRLWTCLKSMNLSQGYELVSRLWTCLKAMNLYQGHERVLRPCSCLKNDSQKRTARNGESSTSLPSIRLLTDSISSASSLLSSSISQSRTDSSFLMSPVSRNRRY